MKILYFDVMFLGSSPTSLTGATSDRLDRSDALRLSGSNLHSTQKLIRDLFQRMITLEQKMRQVEISNDQVEILLWNELVEVMETFAESLQKP
jgi:hypothetical protein